MIETLDVPDLIVSDRRKSRVLDGLISTSGIHKPSRDVHTEITTRFERFMIASRQVEEEPVVAFDPMGDFGGDDELPEL
ncbi:hypothetical protein N9491_06060 [Planktomarina temperata]|nr:hypothetical protein [Planktomarina temperata]